MHKTAQYSAKQQRGNTASKNRRQETHKHKPNKNSPTMGIAPLHMTQLIATCAGVFPPCPEPMSFISPTKGCSFSSLSSLKMAVLGPPGLLPPAVYLPAQHHTNNITW